MTEPKGLVRSQFKQPALNNDLMSDRNPGGLISSTRSNDFYPVWSSYH